MQNILNHQLAHQKFFEELTRIPHGSHHEAAYSDTIVTFAKGKGLRYITDETHNVIVYKNASKGYENHPPVLLQAHMDMVCEKNKNSDHDFEKDPLQLHIEDGWLKANDTTLGADDGCGVAYMLALLDDETLQHPALECVFTVQEEVGLLGALQLKKTYFTAKRMINLDDESGFATCTTSAGGMNIILETQVLLEENTKPAYEICIKGLQGGHSGAEIDKERGNANKLLARLLLMIQQENKLQLGAIEGGMQDNAIPREASAIFCWEGEAQKLTHIVEQATSLFKKELEFSDPGLYITLQPTTSPKAISLQQSEQILQLLLCLPNGLRHRSMQIQDLSTASDNVGVISMGQDLLAITCSLRGALESYIDEYALEIETLAVIFGFTARKEARYPAWSYDAQSEMRNSMQQVCKEMTGKDLGIMATHGGLECGVFKQLEPKMDIVTLGPLMKNIHTPQEALCLQSFDEIFVFLKTFLASL